MQNCRKNSLLKLDEDLAVYAKCIPSEFNRRLSGGLNCLAWWKASEFRQFLLYAGPLLLSDCSIISDSKYKHFLKFSIAMRILLTENQRENVPFAKKLLIEFVNECKIHYGEDFITFNVHTLNHLPGEYLKWGKLDNISCFPFESFLGKNIKGALKSRYKPLEQICKHVSKVNPQTIVANSSDTLGRRCKKQEGEHTSLLQ